jgi:hypothetical protein
MDHSGRLLMSQCVPNPAIFDRFWQVPSSLVEAAIFQGTLRKPEARAQKIEADRAPRQRGNHDLQLFKRSRSRRIRSWDARIN